jgi:hypothetical protein
MEGRSCCHEGTEGCPAGIGAFCVLDGCYLFVYFFVYLFLSTFSTFRYNLWLLLTLEKCAVLVRLMMMCVSVFVELIIVRIVQFLCGC